MSQIYDGRKTASGSIFHSTDYTCAHRTLPFGTKLQVTELRTKKSVIVIVTDRGPYKRDRDLDLSSMAFALLAPLSDGLIHVKYTIVK